MDIQEAREFFADSDFSAHTKKKIAAVLKRAAVLDIFTTEKVKALMQEELERDFAETGVDISDDPRVKKAGKKYKDDLEKIGKETKDDAAFVEKELTKLDSVRKQVVKTKDTMAADVIRKSM